MTRVLVTGSRGQLGRELVAAARAQGHEVHGLSRSERTPCDLTDRAAVAELVAKVRPELVLHAGAWADVDGCELDADRAFDVNAGGTSNVVAAADTVGAHVVLLSTDYVFDGAKTAPYTEEDRPRPLSVYGRSKLLAEEAMGAHHAIARTSWLAGRHGRSLVRTVLQRARAGEALRVVDDQIGHPTMIASLAPALLALGLRRSPGTYHVTNAGTASWYGLARATLVAGGFEPSLVEPILTVDLDPPRPAARPANSVLADTRLGGVGVASLPHFEVPLEQLVADLLHDGA